MHRPNDQLLGKLGEGELVVVARAFLWLDEDTESEGSGGNESALIRRTAASEPGQTFEAALGQAGAVGVRVAGIVQDQTPFRRRYEPSHPDADADGFVMLPNVDGEQEMVDMLGAARAYQANIAAIGMIREMVAKSLELGKG